MADEKDSEVEELRAEVERLKAQVETAPDTVALPVRESLAPDGGVRWSSRS